MGQACKPSWSAEPPAILIVEDEQLVAQALALTLEDLGWKVAAIVGSAPRALAAVEADCPVLALVDVGLKGEMDGIDLAIEFSRRGIRTIFLTGAWNPESSVRAQKAAPLGVLVKPCTAQQLKTLIERALPTA